MLTQDRLHDRLHNIHKSTDISSILLCGLAIGGDKTAGKLVNELEIFRSLIAEEFDANWAGGHDSKDNISD